MSAVSFEIKNAPGKVCPTLSFIVFEINYVCSTTMY